MMDYQYLTLQRQENILWVSLNRPDRGNALSVALMREITQFSEAMHEETEIRVVVLTGEGKNFSTGADLFDTEMLEQQQGPMIKQMRALELGPKMIKAVYCIPQITVAAINGKALGGGACIASACDFRIGSVDCEVGYPESRLGMNLSWLGLPLCTHLVGPSVAKRLVILGKREKSQDLHRWGFLDDVVDADELTVQAQALAEEYAQLPPIPAQMIKRSVNEIVSAMDQAIMHMDRDQFMLALKSKDYGEAIAAFVQKRDPVFTGD